MSVLIKGMEMPKGCDDCFLPLRYCPHAMKENGECPLVELPTQHGRLIDAEALVGKTVAKIQDLMDVIIGQETIIEAEGGG